MRDYFDTVRDPSMRTLLIHLEAKGFIIVPKPYQKPARRGNEESALGPLIGKSHTASLIGGSN